MSSGCLSIGPIIDILQLTQKDLDMMVKAMQIENLELESKYEELHIKCLEMGKVMDIFFFLGTTPGDEGSSETEGTCQS